MKEEDRDYGRWFDEAAAAMRYDPSRYHLRSRGRYWRTLDLVFAHVSIDSQTSVGEVGAGMLLPMLRVATGCQATAYGLAADDIWSQLPKLGVESVQWDLHRGFPVPALRQSHDVVLFCEVIEHLCRFPVEVLTDVSRLIRPGGYLVVSTVNLVRLSNRLRVLAGRSPFVSPFVRTPSGRNHVREYTMRELCQYIAYAGLETKTTRFWALHSSASFPVRVVEQAVPSLRNYVAIVATKPAEAEIESAVYG